MRRHCWGLLVEVLGLLHQVMLESHRVLFPHLVCKEMSKRSLTLVCERRAEKREVIKICSLESSTQWHCTLTRVFLSPRELFPGAETLSVTQYLQSLCRLSFVLCCNHKGALSDAAGARGFGGSQDRGETLASLAIRTFWLFFFFFCQGDNHTQSLARFVKLSKGPLSCFLLKYECSHNALYLLFRVFSRLCNGAH